MQTNDYHWIEIKNEDVSSTRHQLLVFIKKPMINVELRLTL